MSINNCIKLIFLSRNRIINLVSPKVKHVCEMMRYFKNYEVIDLYIISDHIFWFQNLCKWIEYLFGQFGYFVLLTRTLQGGVGVEFLALRSPKKDLSYG